jgi:outer membrane protein assembly factor BamA
VPRRLFLVVFLLQLLPAASAQISLPAHRVSNQTSAIRDITFENMSVLSSQRQNEIVRRLQQQNPAWLGEQTPQMLATFIDKAVLEAYQDEGYWRAKVSSQVTWVRGQGADRQVDASITAIREGEPYWVKSINWSGAGVFPENVLLHALGIHPWEVMTRTDLATGMNAVRRLYITQGYLASTVTPQMDFDDTVHCVSLTLVVDEDKLFYFRNLSVSGLDRTTTRLLEANWEEMRQQPYSEERLRNFCARYLSPQHLTGDPLDYSSSSVDLNTHTVDIQFSFDPVTQAEKTAQ